MKMKSKNIILWEILVVLCIVVMFVSINVVSNKSDGSNYASFNASPELKDKINKENSDGNVSEIVNIPLELKHMMRGPYLFTGGGVVRIVGIPETEKSKINFKDEKGNVSIKGIKISSEKILNNIQIESPDVSKKDIEIISKEDHVKILDKKNKITKVIYLDNDGNVTEEISIAGIVEEKNNEKPNIPEINQSLYPKRNLPNI